ncbi:MAG TPA: TatD family deoxyribonuclease [Dehalococcoidia bacterium]|nr:TatD family deoxyribonuclease [Dehalococcoidia bacterium]
MATNDESLPPMVDAHAHLDEYPDTWLGVVLDQLEEHRIATITVAMAPQAYERGLQIQQRSRYVLAALGVHPWNAHHFVTRLDDLEELLEESPMLGEVGLDFRNVRDPSLYDSQERVFEFFLDAAKRWDKIVNVHTSGAESEVVELLERYDTRRAIIHWYSGPQEPLRRLIERGCYFTFGCELLASESIQQIAAAVPPELLLTETDNPGGPQWVFGEPSMPDLVRTVLQALAIVHKRDLSDMAEQVRRNMLALIGGDPRFEHWKEVLDSGV